MPDNASQLVMLLNPEETQGDAHRRVVALLRSILQAPEPILANFFRNIDYRFVSVEEPKLRLVSPASRDYVARLAHAVPEILYFLPINSIPRFVYLLASIQVVSKDGDPMVDVRIDPSELKRCIAPLFRGLEKAMANAGFSPVTTTAHMNQILDQFGVAYADRNPFFL